MKYDKNHGMGEILNPNYIYIYIYIFQCILFLNSSFDCGEFLIFILTLP
jgi:hypothetical protein